ncbi:MAG: diacylglycerol kinase family lipid kinase [Erysipelotrichia bacterium]|nr:diacylglycerol kinase family lipid kinase [Erysipelotrichia bacterium]NCC55352.1 diacylglycerol kinase family lipid kinase [Erysipelotrichia bacterium]
MKKKLLFILNATAGKATIKNKLYDITDIFIKYDYEVSIHPTQAKNDAYLYSLENIDDYDLIVCSGGDGTLNEVIHAYMEKQAKQPFAYIPTGTTNDFATTINLSKNPITCAKQIMEGSLSAIDIGEINSLPFVYIAAFGFFSDVSYTTSQASKNILGHSAYVLEGMKQFMNMKEYPLKISYDENVIEDSFCYGMITNTLSVGGIHFFNEQDIDLDDGYFECLFIKRPNNPLDLQQLLQAFISKDVRKCSRVTIFKAKNIVIESEQPLAWTIDGEYGGTMQKSVIKNHQGALKIIK